MFEKNTNIFIIIFILIFIIYYLCIYLFNGLLFSYTHNIQYNSIYSYLYIYHEIFYNKDYDIVIPKQDWTIFDVGGNIGLYSLYLNENYSNNTIHVFEPIKELFNKAKHNIESNIKNNNNFYLNNMGLGEKDSNEIINFFPNADGLSTINNDIDVKRNEIIEIKCKDMYFNSLCKNIYSSILSDDVFEGKKENIKIIKMSNYINNNNIHKINLIKIDVEGYELNVIQGIDDIHFNIIDNFIIEVENYNNNNLKDIINLLESKNFIVNNLYPNDSWTMIYAKNKLFI